MAMGCFRPRPGRSPVWPARSPDPGSSQKFLFEIAPTDAATYAGAAAVVLSVTVAACYLPARRILRVQPMIALKSD